MKQRTLILAHVAALITFALAAYAGQASAQEPGWKHSGSIYILTTPEGANLPAAASEEGFPLLVRLDKEFFDFSQARPKGEDIRFFSAAGAPLAYQIEEWDAAKGTASIWVRIPAIKGNARQELKLAWGKSDAASESSGKAVFNESNGYLTVWHMGDPVKDETGTLTAKDVGTTASADMIGQARHFAGSQGIFCGDKITSFPTGSAPNTSQAWFRAEKPNARVFAWGNEHGQGKVVMQFSSPPHVRMECYFSGADVAGGSKIPMSQWVHVVHTYQKGDSRVYVNGILDGTTITAGAPLNIKSPARMWIGGWYDHYNFIGDIDEVRVSKVVRSADWVRLEYENQKPMQTLVGHVVQPGTEFSVSPTQIALLEGKTATVTAKAGGAQKLYWILKGDGRDRIAAVDRFSFTFDAGRVRGDASLTLQLKAVYANEVKTLDVPITVKEDIPDPVFALNAPATWDGRETIEVAANVANLAEMQAKGVGELTYTWAVSGIAVIKEVAPGKLILRRAQNSGKMTVRVAVHNGGTEVTAAATILVKEPAKDAWVQRTPAKDEKPEDNQFYARDDRNEGTLYYNGTLDQAGDTVFLKLYADGTLIKTERQKPAADKSYALSVKLKPGLIKYKVEFGLKSGDTETVRHTVGNLVCGDAYLIDGQSNALATDTGEESPRDTSEWIRSYGGLSGRGDATDWVRDRFAEARRAGLARPNLWCYPVWKMARPEHKAELGWWGMELAKRLVASQNVPIFIVNGAVGGTRIDEHQPTPTNHADLKTIYGRMLWRVEQARLTHGIRAVLWHQGESDQGSDGPDGGYGWETYQRYFLDMSAAWKRDFPNIRHYYIYQIWPNSCSMGNGHGDMLREVQRTLPQHYSNLDILPTLGIKPPGPCHFPLVGWTEFAKLVQPLIERDFYGKTPAASISAANLTRAYYANRANDTIALEFDQPVVWKDGLEGQFYLDGAAKEVASGSVSGKVLTLRLKAASSAKTVTYLHEMNWSQDKLLIGANGIAALTFCDVPLEPAKP